LFLPALLRSAKDIPPKLHSPFPDVGCPLSVTHKIITPRRNKAAQKGVTTMVQDLILALVFLVMIIAPALLAMRADKEEQDIL
jgi:hypothetical protein